MCIALPGFLVCCCFYLRCLKAFFCFVVFCVLCCVSLCFALLCFAVCLFDLLCYVSPCFALLRWSELFRFAGFHLTFGRFALLCLTVRCFVLRCCACLVCVCCSSVHVLCLCGTRCVVRRPVSICWVGVRRFVSSRSALFYLLLQAHVCCCCLLSCGWHCFALWLCVQSVFVALLALSRVACPRVAWLCFALCCFALRAFVLLCFVSLSVASFCLV